MEFERLLRLALQKLSKRPFSVLEIKTYLRKKTSDTDLINQITDYLVGKKYLNDIEFAKWLVESRSRTRPRGKILLQKELKLKGLPPELAVVNLTSQEEFDMACKAVSKKLSRWRKLSRLEMKKKIFAYLYSRGFSSSTIESVFKKVYNQARVSQVS